jgi:hypothetical protein
MGAKRPWKAEVENSAIRRGEIIGARPIAGSAAMRTAHNRQTVGNGCRGGGEARRCGASEEPVRSPAQWPGARHSGTHHTLVRVTACGCFRLKLHPSGMQLQKHDGAIKARRIETEEQTSGCGHGGDPHTRADPRAIGLWP